MDKKILVLPNILVPKDIPHLYISENCEFLNMDIGEQKKIAKNLMDSEYAFIVITYENKTYKELAFDATRLFNTNNTHF